MPAEIAVRLGEATAIAGTRGMLAIAAACPRQGGDVACAITVARSLGLEGFKGAASLDAGARFRRAVAEGMEVEAADHRVLTGLAQKIRLPNSERSRAQAG